MGATDSEAYQGETGNDSILLGASSQPRCARTQAQRGKFFCERIAKKLWIRRQNSRDDDSPAQWCILG
jgi:hypothetical protein